MRPVLVATAAVALAAGVVFVAAPSPAGTAPCADVSEACQEQRLAALEAAVFGSPSPAPPSSATPDPTTPTPASTSPEPSTPEPTPEQVSFFGWDGTTLPPPRLTGGGSVADTGDVRLPWHTNTGLYDPARRAAVLAKPAVALKVQSGTPGNPKVYSDLHVSSVDYTGAHDFVVQFSAIEGDITGTTGTDCVSCYFVHDDIGSSRGGKLNSKGSADFYRNDLWGYLDGVSPWNSAGEVVVQENFIHDLQWQQDSGQASGFSHNDSVQPKVNGGTTTLRYNTLWTWMWNGSTQKGLADRDSGPNWGKTPAASAAATGGHNQTSGVLSGDTCCPSRRLNVIGNLFRGAAEHYIQHRGTGGDLLDNRFSSVESEAGAAVIGSLSRQHFTRVSGNTYWAGDPKAGQAVTG